MATYKLLQDIEAEDHILGPLTLRQFVFALITCFLLWLCFFVTTKGAAFLLVILLPPTIFFGFFSLPLGRDQPTEIWALAKLRYFFKPRRRVWNQDGVKELVTITAPRKVEPVLTNGLSQTEVKSRLQALADTLDTRGWAIKNVNTATYTPPYMGAANSDRLLEVASMPHPVADVALPASADMFDDDNSPIAQQFDEMIGESSQAHRQQLIDQMNGVQQAQPSNDYWFMNGNAQAASSIPMTQATNISREEEKALTNELKAKSAPRPSPYSNLRTVQPLGTQPPAIQADNPNISAPVTATPDPAILSLAKNDDLNVSTLAREARRANGEDLDSDEVVIPLH